jgi:hypothetical protein
MSRLLESRFFVLKFDQKRWVLSAHSSDRDKICNLLLITPRLRYFVLM